MTNSYHAHVQIEYCFEFTGTASEIDAVLFVDFQSEFDWLGAYCWNEKSTSMLCLQWHNNIYIFFII